MKKKVLFLAISRAVRLLATLLLLVLSEVVQAQFNYIINNGTITLTTGNCYKGALTIPSTILVNGANLPVTAIGSQAFYYCSSLTSVTISNNVTSIGSESFETCLALTNVTVGNSVTNIGNSAFYSCYYLNHVMIGNGVSSIAPMAFLGCGLINGFTVDPSNSFYSSHAGVLFNKNQTTIIQCPEKLTGTYTVSNSVTSIGDNAFAGSSLTNIIISNSVTNIGDNAFAGANLTSITIGNSVGKIGNNDFEGCSRLASIMIPNSVTSIGTNVFEGCSSLTKVTMSDRVTSIGSEAFFGCSSLTNIMIPNSVTNIGDNAFGECSNLISIIIPSSISSIKSWAFINCPVLKQVIFLGNQPNADATVFVGDNNVTVYYLPETTGWGAVFGNFSNASTVVSSVLWNPHALNSRANFGIQTNQFGFNITGTTNIPIVVDASTSLASGVWTSLQACTITNGSINFSDPNWTNYPARYYRIRTP